MKKLTSLFYDEKYQGALIAALIFGLVIMVFISMFVF